MVRLGMLIFVLLFSTGLAEAACLSAKQTRAAIQSGQVAPLNVIARSINGTISRARVCGTPGNYVYRLVVRAPNGKVTKMQVRAR